MILLFRESEIFLGSLTKSTITLKHINNIVREDSQIDFATGKAFFHVWGGGGGAFTQECFSNFSNSRFFQAEKLPEKPCQQGRIL